MSQKRTYYGFSTPQQRKLLFETWQATGKIAAACATARVSPSLFYYWKPRFDQAGYDGLEAFQSRTAHHLNTKAEAIAQQVVALRQAHRTGARRASRRRWPRPITGCRSSVPTR